MSMLIVGKSDAVREWHCVVDGAVGGTHRVVVQGDKDGCTLECEGSKRV